MLENLKTIIAEQLNVNEDEIKEESNFKDDLGADSLDLFELVMSLEEELSLIHILCIRDSGRIGHRRILLGPLVSAKGPVLYLK